MRDTQNLLHSDPAIKGQFVPVNLEAQRSF
jgi:hypothetical protein